MEFVFVDDGSGDSSMDVLRDLAQRDSRVKVIALSRNFGSNAAILAGLTYCHGDCAVVLSADLQDPPELIPEMVAEWRKGYQVVLAARRRRNDPLVTRVFSWIFNRLFRRLVFREFPENGFDFMLVDRCVIDILVKNQEKNSFIFGQTLWVGFRRSVIQYDRSNRPQGVSRWTFAKKVKYFIDAFAAFSYLPLRAASLLGLLFATLGFLYAALIVALRLARNITISGWSSLMVVVLVTAGMQLLLTGLLGEYLWRALDEVRRRPPYIVREMLNVEPALRSTTAVTGDVHARQGNT